MDEQALREQMRACGQRLLSHGLCVGSAGNISVRCEEALLITPSGADYNSLTAGDMVKLSLAGEQLSGELRPSSEWPMHCAIMAERPDAAAIVHTHSPHATALACCGRDIPAFHYMVAVAGGASIRCAPYATFGSPELAGYALDALDHRQACLLANHGVIALGGTLEKAFALAVEVENLAAQYTLVLQLGGGNILDDAAMAEVMAAFAHYGPGRRE
ncbi:MAG: class II aldolase/adducin family protein [Anaerolineae bacterium]